MGVVGAGTLAGQPPCRHSHQTSLQRTQTCTAHPPLCSRVQLALLVNTSTREERSRWGLFIVPAPAYAFENPTQHCSQKCTEAQLASSNSALHFCTFTASFSPEMHFTVCALSQNKRGEASKCWLLCFRNFAQGRLIDGQSDVQMAGHWILRLVSRKTLKSGQGFPSLCALRQVCVHLNARLGAVHGASMTSVCWHLSEGIQSKDCFPEGLCKRSQSLSTMYDEHAQNQLCPLQ